VTDFGADVSFEAAAEKMKEHYRLEVPTDMIRKIRQEHARKIGWVSRIGWNIGRNYPLRFQSNDSRRNGCPPLARASIDYDRICKQLFHCLIVSG